MLKKFRNSIALLIVAIVALSTFGQSASAAGSNVTFEGKGNGHGVGMSQYGAKGMADQKKKYDAILKYYYTGVKLETKNTSTQKIRVLVGQKLSSATVSATTDYAIKDTKGKTIVNMKAGETAKISYSKGKYSIYSSANKKTYTSSYALNLVPTKSGASGYKNLKYDGTLHLYQSGSKMYVVNHVLTEDYVAGVLPYEMYATWPAEALKAQSVAARTYALKRVGTKGNWDVDDTITYQVYKGKSDQEKRMKELTKGTKGKVLTHNGKYIDALFYASSGGHTVSAQYIWTNSVPYLKGKKDPYDTSDYTKKGWKYTISKKDLGNRYGIGTVKSIQVTKKAENHAVTVKLTGTKKSVTVTANSLRSKLGMKSTLFVIK